MDENELLQRLKKGEEEAFEFIFKNNFTGLCLFAEHFVNDSQAAEDLVEEFFCHLWENNLRIDIQHSLRGYLYRGVYNRCLKYLRHQNVALKYLDHRQGYLRDIELLERQTDSYPVANLIALELEGKITTVINALPEHCRNIFCLNRFENLTYVEISQKLNISVNTVKTQMARALQKLREELKEYLVLVALIFSTLS